jgi:predicted nucleic acid-binding Zn ribbon protein
MKNENHLNTMYCRHCGNKISKEAYVCPKCGLLVNEKKKNQQYRLNHGLVFGLV